MRPYKVSRLIERGYCPEHGETAIVWAEGYRYVYPSGAEERIAGGWLCIHCMRRGYIKTWEENPNLAMKILIEATSPEEDKKMMLFEPPVGAPICLTCLAEVGGETLKPIPEWARKYYYCVICEKALGKRVPAQVFAEVPDTWKQKIMSKRTEASASR